VRAIAPIAIERAAVNALFGCFGPCRPLGTMFDIMKAAKLPDGLVDGQSIIDAGARIGFKTGTRYGGFSRRLGEGDGCHFRATSLPTPPVGVGVGTAPKVRTRPGTLGRNDAADRAAQVFELLAAGSDMRHTRARRRFSRSKNAEGMPLILQRFGSAGPGMAPATDGMF